jgi:hypothetical protein
MNAEEHVRQPCVVNVDVKEFFPNVRHYPLGRCRSPGGTPAADQPHCEAAVSQGAANPSPQG